MVCPVNGLSAGLPCFDSHTTRGALVPCVAGGPATQGTKAPLVVWLSKQGSPADSPLTGQTILTPEQALQFAAGQWYVNVHTQANPGGEIRGQAIPPKN